MNALPAAAVIVTSVYWSLVLAFTAPPPATGAVILIALGLPAVALTAAAGMLLGGSRWSRHTGGVVTATALGLAATQPLSPWTIAGIFLAGGALYLTLSNWLDVRRRPSADGPPPAAVTLVLILVAQPLVAGLAGWNGVNIALIAWVTVALMAALSINRATLSGLWAARVLIPAIGGWTTVANLLPGLAIGLSAAIVGWLAWRPDVRLSVAPLVASPGVPTPPELVDPSLLRTAGYDDRGAPI